MIEGLSHITFIVKDLDRTENLFVKVFGAEKIYDSGDQKFSLSKERFFLIAGLWIVIMEGDSLHTQTYNHVAFKIPDSEFDTYLKRLQDAGVTIHQGRPRVGEEGRSIYFYDYDNHMFELHTGTLDERMARYSRK